MKLRKNLFRLFSGRFCAALVIFSLIFSTTASGVSAARHGMGRGELPRHALRAQQEQESFGPKQLRPALQKASAGRSRSGLEEIGVIPDAHKGPVVSVAFNPVDRAPDLLATAAPDGFRLWSARGTQPSRHPLKDSADGFLVGQPGIKVVQFSTNGRDLLSVGPTKTLRYEVAHGRKMGSPLEHKDPLVPSQFQEQMLIALSPGRTAAAVGHTGGSGVVVWNLAKGRMKKPGGQIRGPMKSLFFSARRFLSYKRGLST